jgi:hypothetical protein
MTWRLLVNIFRTSLTWPRLTAFLLTLPVTILGIYCIFPHPFYDPDATLFVLLSLSLILWAERRGFPVVLTFIGGFVSVIPLFVKQNIGLAFLAGGALALVILILVGLKRKQPVKGYLVLFSGSVTGLAVAAAIVRSTVGLATYKYWTWDFATSRRTPSIQDMLSVYQDPLLPVWLLVVVLGLVVFWINKTGNRLLSAFAFVLISVPFLWPLIYLFIDEDPSERGERLANLWPVVLIAAFVFWLLNLRREATFRGILPLILIGTAHGVFLSQQLWGSTYGIWPLFVLLVGSILWSINELTERRPSEWLTLFALVFAASLGTAGAFYVYSNERLDTSISRTASWNIQHCLSFRA